MSPKSKPKKTAREKLEKVLEAQLVEIPPKMEALYGPGMMLIPKPLDIETLIRQVEKGKLITQKQIREKLARDAQANVACPITTGIFIRLVAEAAEEDVQAGIKQITPYWRVLKPDGGLNEKFPGGVETQEEHLRQEGYIVEAGRGKKPPKVKDYEKYLIQLD